MACGVGPGRRGRSEEGHCVYGVQLLTCVSGNE